MHGEPLKGHLDTMLLAALRDGPAHGYALVRLLEQRSDGVFVLGEGTIYPGAAPARARRAAARAARASSTAARAAATG